MTLSLLAAVLLLFLALMACMAGGLFGREWWRSRREAGMRQRLRKHSGLVVRLRDGTEGERQEAVAEIRSLAGAGIREAVLDAALEGAGAEGARRIARTFDDLGITDRHIDTLRNHRSWERRAMAAERLGRIGSARAVFPLLAAVRDVKDEDEDVRGAAIRALGRIRDPAAIPELIGALGNPAAAIPQRIAEILVQFGDDAVGPLCGEIRDPDSEVRRMWAAEILGWIGNPAAAIPLIDALGDVNPEVRAKAAGALGKFREARAIDRLLEMLLSDPIPFVRTRVAQALGAIGHPRVVDHLVQVLNDPEWWVRIRAIEALEQIGGESAGVLVAALEDQDAEVRRRAATALERMGYVRSAVETLEREGFRPDILRILLLVGKAGVTEGVFGRIRTAKPPAKKLLVRIAGDIGDASAVPVLVELLSTCDEASLRSRLVEAIGRLRAPEAAPVLLRYLKDPDSWVRRAAVEALSGDIPRDRCGEILALIRDSSPETRIAVLRVAAGMEAAVAGPEVERLLADPSPEVRAEALRAAAALAIEGAEPRVASLLEDPSAAVRLEAARALSRVGSAESVPRLMRVARSADEAMRGAVVDAVVRGFRGPFPLLRGWAGDAPSREQVAVLLEAASRLEGEGRREFVERYVADPDPFLRRAAVYALRGFPGGEAGEAIRRALDDPDESVRDAGVQVAASVGETPLRREIARRADDPNGAVRFHAALALGVTGAPEFREVLRRLAGDALPTVRAAAVLGLALSGDPAIRGDIARYAADAELCAAAREAFVPSSPDPLVGLAVSEARRRGSLEAGLFLGGSLYALEKEMGRRAREALSEPERLHALEICDVIATGQSYTTALAILRNDPSPDVRLRAADLLVKARRDAESGKVVGTLLSDPHPKVRMKAARLLGGMEFPEVVEILLNALGTPDRLLREEVTTALSAHLLREPEKGRAILSEIPPGKARKLGVVWLLGKTRQEGSMKTLLRYLEDGDGDVRAAAVGALAKYHVGLVARPLRKSLADPNARVRAAAVNALSSLRTEEGEATMSGMLSDPDFFVRQRAAMALIRMGASAVSDRIRGLSDEPPELRAVWLAGGVYRGEVPPEDAAAAPDASRFLGELLPEAEAVRAARESPDPAVRGTAFRVLRLLSPERAKEAAAFLSEDPDPRLREGAKEFLRERGD
jgi:HEAT repeat protein